jgi:perosamine synthetase
MFEIKKVFGNHKVLHYDIEKFPFRRFIQELYKTDNIEDLHNISKDYKKYNDGEHNTLENIETDLQKIFYTNIKSESTFKELYCNFIANLYKEIFPEEDYLIYQTFPSIRFQYPNNIAVPPHCDSDKLGKHPLGEINFLLPITLMKGSTRIFIESEPSKGDYQGVDLEYGDIFFFNGNKCIHYNEKNIENYLRISFDFRVMKKNDYMAYIMNMGVTQTNPRDAYKERVPLKICVGGYYQCMFKNQNIKEYTNWFTNTQFILQTRPIFNASEGEACEKYFNNGDPFLTEFKETEKLESQLSKIIGVKHCFMTTSGSTALVVALLACGIGIGDEVLVPNYTMVASANAVKLLGAKPILIDVDEDTYTINLGTIRKYITHNTKAILHVSLNNRSKDIESIVAFSKENGIFLIEDAAQSLGCRINRKHYGTFGDIGCFSLSTPKIITTGQGGFVVTNNDELSKKIICIKNFGRSSGGVEEYNTFGLNFKFTDIQAVIGQAQLTKLDERVKRMREIYNIYATELKDVSGIKILEAQTDEWIPWFIEIFHEQRDVLSYFLKQHNIGTRITYPCIHTTEPYYKEYLSTLMDFSNSKNISSKGLFLPSHTSLTDNDIKYICSIIRIY